MIKIFDSVPSFYDEYVGVSSDYSLFYNSSYLRIVSKILNCKLLFFVYYDYGNVVGIMPVMIKQGGLGEVLNSLPYYGGHGGAIADSQVYENLLKFHVLDYAKKQGIKSVVYIGKLFGTEKNKVDFDCLYYTDYRIGQVTNLPDKREDLFDIFHSKTRNSIRKSTGYGYKITDEIGYIDFLYSTHVENISELGGRVKEKSFFDAVLDSDIDFKLLTMLDHKANPVSSLLTFEVNRVVEYFTPVLKREYRHTQALSGLIYESMKEYVGHGSKLWNWGGTWKNQSGVYRFKSRFGAVDYRYNYEVYILDENFMTASREKILSDYDGFYCIPFEELVENG